MRNVWPLLLSIVVAACAGRAPAVQNAGPAATPVPILTRAQWDAKPPTSAMRPQTIRRITIHNTGERSRPDLPLARKLQALQTFSQRDEPMSNGAMHHAWPDVPYHYYIASDGQLAEGRDWHFAGDTNTTYDPSGHLLIVLEGSFNREQPTPAQLQTLRAMVAWAARRWHVPADSLAGHRDFARTDCPGNNLYAQLDSLRLMLRTVSR